MTFMRKVAPLLALAVATIALIISLMDSVHRYGWSLSSIGPDKGGETMSWNFGTDITDRDLKASKSPDGFDVIDRGRNRSPLRVGEAGLTHGTSVQPNAAGYLQRHLADDVETIGATVDFGGFADDDVRDGAVALIIAKASLPLDPARFDQQVPDMGVHFVFDSKSWVMGVWDAQDGLIVLDAGQFQPALVGRRSVNIVRSGSLVSISLPNGQLERVDDERISSDSGSWAAWELYEQSPGTTAASLSKAWVR